MERLNNLSIGHDSNVAPGNGCYGGLELRRSGVLQNPTDAASYAGRSLHASAPRSCIDVTVTGRRSAQFPTNTRQNLKRNTNMLACHQETCCRPI